MDLKTTAIIRFMMIEYAAGKPVLWAEIRKEAVARHTTYMTWLHSQGLLTKEIVEDHTRLIQWYYDQGGWKQCQVATPTFIDNMWGDT